MLDIVSLGWLGCKISTQKNNLPNKGSLKKNMSRGLPEGGIKPWSCWTWICPAFANSRSRSVGFWRSQLIWYLHFLSFSMWTDINNLDQVIWLAKNLKWVWHLNLFSMTRVNDAHVICVLIFFIKKCWYSNELPQQVYKGICCGYSFELPWQVYKSICWGYSFVLPRLVGTHQGNSDEYPQDMLLWKSR